MSLAQCACPPEDSLDFSRYAAPRPALVWSSDPDQPTSLPPDISDLVTIMRGCAGLFGCCFMLTAGLIRRRTVEWFEDQYFRILGSLSAAWTLAGIGWGGFISLPIYLYLMG